jgi:hypothetical protein
VYSYNVGEIDNRRRKEKTTAVLPVWETTVQPQGLEDQNLDDIPEQEKSFLPEQPTSVDVDSNEISKV